MYGRKHGEEMKTIKDGEVRRREILMVARKLFVQKGYDKTSINDILEIVDIAKGTFYYYFSSKEEVLESIIVDIVDEGVNKAKGILTNRSIPIFERIMMAIMAQRPDFEGAQEIQKEMHKVENTKLEQLYLKHLLKKLPPLLAETLKEGNEEGSVKVENPLECMESILLLGHMFFDCNICDWQVEEFPVKIQSYLSNIEKMCGVEKGKLQSFKAMFGQL